MKYIDPQLNIQEDWKIFCRKLYQNVIELEKETILKDAKLRQSGQTYSQRRHLKEKLTQCERYKLIIKKSATKKEFNLQDGDEEIILEKGWDFYFRNLNGELIYD